MKNKQKMQNIIVLRDLPSNIIDEAIIVLKEGVKKKVYTHKNERSKYIIDEANIIVNDYINKAEAENITEIKNKYKKTKVINRFLTIISIVLFMLVVVF